MKNKNIVSPMLFLGAALLIGGGLCSCDKEEVYVAPKKQESTLTPAQNRLKENLNAIALLVTDMADENDLFQEIHKGVGASLNIGLDEQYRFKDILNPSECPIGKLRSAAIGKFGEKFKNALGKSALRSATAENLEQFILDEDVQIYWPYSEQWDGVTQPVISFNPISDVDENIGFRKVTRPDGSVRIDTVLINDDYAFKNPVWIINFCENKQDEIVRAQKKTIRLKSSTSTYQLSIGSVMSKKHYDNLFQGGDEYKFILIGGKITSMNTAESFECVQTVDMPRCYIRNESWRGFYYELDDDWRVEADNSEMGRQFAIIEYDEDKTERELKFEPKVTINKVSVSMGSYSVKTESSEGWIKIDRFDDRDKMMQNQFTNMGLGLKDGYRINGAGEVYWTLPIRKF